MKTVTPKARKTQAQKPYRVTGKATSKQNRRLIQSTGFALNWAIANMRKTEDYIETAKRALHILSERM